MHINPVEQYWVVTRSTVNAVIRPVQGLDLLMFPYSLAFDSLELAQDYCDRFNHQQSKSGKILPLSKSMAIAN